MATKNLVPRGDLEGSLGLSNRRWIGINAQSGSFSEIKADELKNLAGNDLLVQGDNITIEKLSADSGAGSQYKISSSGGGTSTLDKIFEGPVGSQTSVETFNTTDPILNKISFAISGNEKWFINSDGHFVPSTNSLDLGLSGSPVRDLYLLNDGLNLGTSNLKIDSSSKLQLGTLVGGSLVYEDVTTALEDVKFATTGAINLATDLVNNLQIDGQSLTTGDRVLVKDQATATENGIYIVAASGAASRANDLSVNSDFSAIRVTVLKGEKHSQQIFFTVPHTDGSSKTNVSNMKWVKLGSGGLEAVVDDPAPTLGGDLSVGTRSIKTSSDELKMIAESDSNSLKSELKLQGTVSGSILVITSNTNGDTKLSLETQGGKRLRIENVNDNFFTSNNLSTTFTYKFSPSLTATEKNNGEAFFATQGWVSDQGYLSSADLNNYVTTTYLNNQNFIRTADDASLTSLRLGDSYTPSNDKDAATKEYVDTYAQGLREILDPVRVATPLPGSGSPINLATDLEAGDSLDSITLVAGDRVLVKDQTDPINNGIYVVAASGAASRSADFTANDRVASKFVFVEQGAENANSGFICTTPAGTNASPTDVVGNNSITFAKFSAAGQISAGNGISKSGNTISANIDATTIVFDTENNNKLKVGSIDASQITGTLDEARLPNNIVADSVDENAIDPDGIDTSLTALADGDLFIVKDIDSSAAIKTTKATASVLRDYIRSDIKGFTGQVDFADDTSNSTIKAELNTKAITDQYLYYGPNTGAAGDGPLQDNDLFLLYDADETALLKKVRYADIKASTIDIGSYTAPLPGGIGNDDLLLIKNSEDNTHRKIKIEDLKTSVSSKMKYVQVNEVGAVDPIEPNTHYHIANQTSTTNAEFVFNLTVSHSAAAGDIIKITMSPAEFDRNDDNEQERRHMQPRHVVLVKLPNSRSITLNKNDFTKPVEFIYDGALWQTSLLSEEEFFYRDSLSLAQLPTYLTDQAVWSYYPNLFIHTDSESLSFSIPPASTVRGWGYKTGDKKTLYFTHSSNKKITINSGSQDILVSDSNEASTSNQKVINLNSSTTSIKKVVLTLAATGNNAGTPVWIIEHYLDESSVTLPSALTGTAPDDAHKVLQFDANGNTLEKSKIDAVNINDNAIITAKIKDEEVTKAKLSKVTANRVLGYVGSLTGNQSVSEVTVLDDLTPGESGEITNKHTNLVTAQAIKDYVIEHTSFQFSLATSIESQTLTDVRLQQGVRQKYVITSDDVANDGGVLFTMFSPGSTSSPPRGSASVGMGLTASMFRFVRINLAYSNGLRSSAPKLYANEANLEVNSFVIELPSALNFYDTYGLDGEFIIGIARLPSGSQQDIGNIFQGMAIINNTSDPQLDFIDDESRNVVDRAVFIVTKEEWDSDQENVRLSYKEANLIATRGSETSSGRRGFLTGGSTQSIEYINHLDGNTNSGQFSVISCKLKLIKNASNLFVHKSFVNSATTQRIQNAFVWVLDVKRR